MHLILLGKVEGERLKTFLLLLQLKLGAYVYNLRFQLECKRHLFYFLVVFTLQHSQLNLQRLVRR